MPEPQAMKTPTLRDAGVAAAAMGSMYVLLLGQGLVWCARACPGQWR